MTEITAEEVAEAALPWLGSGDPAFREICKRLGGRFQEAAERYEAADTRRRDELAARHALREVERRLRGPRHPSPELRAQVFERDGYECLQCGATAPLTPDHIIPWSKGGSTTLENLQTLCVPCDLRKGAR